MSIGRLISLMWILSFIVISLSCQSNDKQPPTDDERISLLSSSGIGANSMGFEKLGFNKGNKVPDFTLFTVDGNRFEFPAVLKEQKPILLISGSYTCDITRRNIPDINALAYKYLNKLAIYFVYTIDAHPSDVASPYSKKHRIEISTENRRDHIEAKQPKTYGERKLLARKCQQQNTMLIPTLVDTPTNDFWLRFGQAPNMAYLIETDGTIGYRQTWFNYNDLDASIRDLLYKQEHNIQ